MFDFIFEFQLFHQPQHTLGAGIVQMVKRNHSLNIDLFDRLGKYFLLSVPCGKYDSADIVTESHIDLVNLVGKYVL